VVEHLVDDVEKADEQVTKEIKSVVQQVAHHIVPGLLVAAMYPAEPALPVAPATQAVKMEAV
jgi:hypothetical protein